ncbi:hypothetical protein BcDW1_3613 [Botrytis cinerea BcDW1]|uniref:Uncharacterized protein n=1 Tax=Botryotinia fuckeliana (strain BcDW1) TaxID=1290391 RepID=M7TVW4_BOTF1|nr:hypothetical protein BcDW1_3613 [Botrytis cinerea BcDW1]
MPRSAQYCITLPVEIIDIRPPQLAQSPRKPIPLGGWAVGRYVRVDKLLLYLAPSLQKLKSSLIYHSAEVVNDAKARLTKQDETTPTNLSSQYPTRDTPETKDTHILILLCLARSYWPPCESTPPIFLTKSTKLSRIIFKYPT